MKAHIHCFQCIQSQSIQSIQNIQSIQSIKQYICSISFLKYAPNEIESPSIDAAFATYVARINSDKAFVKHELFKMIKDSVNPYYKVPYDPSATLYTQYVHMVGPTSPYMTYCCNAGHLEPNPLTKFMVPMPAIEIQDISIYDLLKLIYSRDSYFCRLCYQGVTLIATERMPTSLDVNVAFGTDASIKSVCPNAFHVSKDDLADAMYTAPRLSKRCIVYGGEGDYSFSKDPLTTTTISPFSKKYPEVFDLVMRIELQKATGVKVMGMPLSIQECIVQLFEECNANKKNADDNNNTKNCVLLIDNRENIFSVMATTITLSNLSPNMWNLVIMTGANARPYYTRWFPDAKFLEDMEGKFNIETYNHMIKDTRLWQQLADMGYVNCLTVQDDAIIIKPGMEEVFLNRYDYVGAPWAPAPFLKAAGVTDDYVGNGGLSLRNVPFLLDICKTCDPKEKRRLFYNELQPEPEDIFFSAQVAKRKGRIPNHHLASRFAMEQITNMDTFGIHKPWPYVGEQIVLKILQSRVRQTPPVQST